MSVSWKTVRVFISSTFPPSLKLRQTSRDMPFDFAQARQAERDHLVRFVFPELREQLLSRRIHLVDVDLRWGACRMTNNECRIANPD